MAVVYEPLSPAHFRLIELWRGQNDEIQARLRVFPLAEAPKYNALSYVWGSPQLQATLKCGASELRISENLSHALEAVTNPANGEGALTLWIDQLCINQDDAAEKAVQVQIMGDIFHQAERVLVWLGRCSLDARTFDECTEMLRGLDKKTNSSPRRPRPHLPTGDHPVWTLASEMLGASWHSRVWTFQEAVLARRVTVFFDRHVTTLTQVSMLERAVSDLRKSGHLLAMAGRRRRAEHIYGLARFRGHHRAGKKLLLSDLLALVYGKECTLRLDLVYGVLGLVDKVQRDEMPIDYSRDFESVLLDAFKICMRHESDYRLLNSTHPFGTIRAFPSWCPDLGAAPASHGLPTHAYSAGTRPKPDVAKEAASFPICHISAPANALQIRGMLVDVVKQVSSRTCRSMQPPQGMEPDEFRATWKELDEAHLALARATTGDASDATLEMHARTTIGDHLEPFGRNPLLGQDEAQTLRLYRLVFDVDWSQANPWSAISKKDESLRLIYLASLESTLRGRRYFSTAGRRLGVGPEKLEPGDRVCVLFDARTPFILRPADDGSFSFVGDAYVHGLMDGEALGMLDAGIVEAAEVKIV